LSDARREVRGWDGRASPGGKKLKKDDPLPRKLRCVNRGVLTEGVCGGEKNPERAGAERRGEINH